MKVIEVKFGLHDKVFIDPLESKGVVMSIWFSETGTQYSVRYFYNGKAETIYFFEDELSVRV